MYYPIIDKLKDVMAEISQGGGGSLVIDGTPGSGSPLNGTYNSDLLTINNSMVNGTPVFFRYTLGHALFMIPIISCPVGGNEGVAYGATAKAEGSTLNVNLNSDGTFIMKIE